MLGSPAYWETAKTQLMANDRVLRKLIPAYDSEGFEPPVSPFVTLIRAVLAQKASRKTALTQWQSLAKHFGLEPEPDTIAILSAKQLQKIGLPLRKAEYIIGVSHSLTEGRLDLTQLAQLENEQVIHRLTEIRGIGRWTAEMFLIFNLRRADVLPLDDAALLKAISKHYFSGEPVSRFEAREVAQAWAPWCTVATWHLWRSLEAVAVHY